MEIILCGQQETLPPKAGPKHTAGDGPVLSQLWVETKRDHIQVGAVGLGDFPLPIPPAAEGGLR
jgi:hypothetical protein